LESTATGRPGRQPKCARTSRPIDRTLTLDAAAVVGAIEGEVTHGPELRELNALPTRHGSIAIAGQTTRWRALMALAQGRRQMNQEALQEQGLTLR
jgi:hypothetical protein